MLHPTELPRRRFLGVAAAAVAYQSTSARAASAQGDELLREFFQPYLIKSASLDRFFDPNTRNWAKFHPKYGYLLRNSFIRDGVDGSHTLARYEETGQRQQINFRDQPCRINTYGDSFTQGHQVSDGETWQEILAAHFCEPIRNFGIGGFGVYQASQRLLEIEAAELNAEHLIFNIWGDDHFRSIYPWRWLAFPPDTVETMSGVMFHAIPWVHAALDAQTGELIDRPNPCPDEASLRRLGDIDFVMETFGREPVVHAMFASRTGLVADQEILQQLAALLNRNDLRWDSPDQVRESAHHLLHRYGIQVGMKVIERLHRFAAENHKRLMVLLSYPAGSVWHACNATSAFNNSDHVDWHPAEFRQYVHELDIPLVDSLESHVAEFKTFRLSAKAYVDRYYIGHYTPAGNHFFAYAIKDRIREWLHSAPPAYRDSDAPPISFKGYLPG